jgi:hypothetical protein
MPPLQVRALPNNGQAHLDDKSRKILKRQGATGVTSQPMPGSARPRTAAAATDWPTACC